MKRNRSVDIFRAGALLLVMIYHGWVLLGSKPFSIPIIATIISLGGEIGVTAFFALSGYGIYYSLRRMEDEYGKIHYGLFLKRRLRRIVPDYEISLLIVLFFLWPHYFSVSGILNFITHALFIHNLFPQYSGTINGVLWTMGVTVQFYLIAPLLYKGFKKFGLKMEILCILGTITMKFLMYAMFLPNIEQGASLAFFSGRQLITALDNFSIGMFIAYILNEKKISMDNDISVFIFILSILQIIGVSQLGLEYGIHTNNVSGYIWHSLLAIGIGGILISISCIKSKNENIISRIFLRLSRYEYTIYIWHLLILQKLLEFTAIQEIINKSELWKVYIIYILLSVFIGEIMAKVVEWGIQKCGKK